MLHRFKQLRIKMQLAILSFLVVGIIVLLIVYSYNQFASVVEDKNLQANQILLGQIKKSQDEVYKLFEKMIFNLSYSPDVQSFLIQHDPVKRVQDAQNTNNIMRSLINLSDGIEDIVIIGGNGDQLSFMGNLSTIRQVKALISEMPFDSKLYVTELMTCPSGKALSCMLLEAPIFSLDSANSFYRNIGVVGFIVEARELAGLQEELHLQNDVILLVTDREGQLITSNNPAFEEIPQAILTAKQSPSQWTANTVLAGKQYLTHREEIPFLAGHLISLTPLDLLHLEIRKVRRDEIIILSVSILILAILLSYIVSNIVRPLRKLLQFMHEIKRDAYAMNRQIDLSGYAEISVVANHFNRMLNEVQQLTDQIVSINSRMYQTELERKNAQYHFLKSQINPHFLYNTLETIKGLAVMKGVHEIRDIAKALGQMFRYAVKGGDEIPLFKEIDMINNYLRIQQFRFQDKISMEFRLPENTMSCQIPKMILQPIVENAIYHGLEPKVGKGRLVISSSLKDRVLTLMVEDDGVGMTQEKLDIVQRLLAAKEPSMSDDESGVGLMNTHKRVQIKYGNAYGLEVNSQEGDGTVMRIKIPLGEDGYV